MKRLTEWIVCVATFVVCVCIVWAIMSWAAWAAPSLPTPEQCRGFLKVHATLTKQQIAEYATFLTPEQLAAAKHCLGRDGGRRGNKRNR